jgi:hypothetical protein
MNDGREDEILKGVEGSNKDDYIRRKSSDDNDKNR